MLLLHDKFIILGLANVVSGEELENFLMEWLSLQVIIEKYISPCKLKAGGKREYMLISARNL